MVKVGIIGGSIGGLTAACLLRDRGIAEVEVFERSHSELEQRGAGIGFLEPASRYLKTFAKIDLDDISVKTQKIRYLDRQNDITFEKAHTYRFSSWTTVYKLLLRSFDSDSYKLGQELVDWENGSKAVTAKFKNGESATFDLMICADGVGSDSRKKLLPNVLSNYSGYVAWRGMVSESDLDQKLRERLSEAITYYVFANSHILVYPIPSLDGSVKKGERLINFVWYRNYAEGSELSDLLTGEDGKYRSISVPPGLLKEHHVLEAKAVAKARMPRDIANLVDATQNPFIQVVYDVSVDKMVFQRICLLGDAAFVARPHAAAGSAKAAEDGWQLANLLEKQKDIDKSLKMWESMQLRLGKDLIKRTRLIGDRSQLYNNWNPEEKRFLFGLHKAGE